MYNAKISKRKSLLKEYKTQNGTLRTVYLNDSDEFEIMLFNPKDTVIAAEVSINGEVFSRKIVIHPGERIWLDRFIDIPEKMIFKAYLKEDNLYGRPAENGLIQVSFYDKLQYICESYSDNHDSSVLTAVFTAAPNKGCLQKGIDCSIYNANGFYNTSSVSACVTDKSSNAKKETGRHSDTKFSDTYDSFCLNPFATEVIKILPMSQKPVYSKDLAKRYCSACGRRIKSSFKFCPYCGNKL